MAPTESPMMATLPLFSATVTTSHPCQTNIGAPSEYFLYSNTTNKPAFLSLPLPTSTMLLEYFAARPKQTGLNFGRKLCIKYMYLNKQLGNN